MFFILELQLYFIHLKGYSQPSVILGFNLIPCATTELLLICEALVHYEDTTGGDLSPHDCVIDLHEGGGRVEPAKAGIQQLSGAAKQTSPEHTHTHTQTHRHTYTEQC